MTIRLLRLMLRWSKSLYDEGSEPELRRGGSGPSSQRLGRGSTEREPHQVAEAHGGRDAQAHGPCPSPHQAVYPLPHAQARPSFGRRVRAATVGCRKQPNTALERTGLAPAALPEVH